MTEGVSRPPMFSAPRSSSASWSVVQVASWLQDAHPRTVWSVRSLQGCAVGAKGQRMELYGLDGAHKGRVEDGVVIAESGDLAVCVGENSACVLMRDGTRSVHSVRQGAFKMRGDVSLPHVCLTSDGAVCILVVQGSVYGFVTRSVPSRKPLRPWSADGSATCLACASITRAFSGHLNGTVSVWDVRTGELVRALAGHRGAVFALFQSGPHLFSVANDGRIIQWAYETGEPRRSWNIGQRFYTALETIDDERFLVVRSKLALCIIDLVGGRVSQFLLHRSPIMAWYAPKYSPGWIHTLTKTGTISSWKLQCARASTGEVGKSGAFRHNAKEDGVDPENPPLVAIVPDAQRELGFPIACATTQASHIGKGFLALRTEFNLGSLLILSPEMRPSTIDTSSPVVKVQAMIRRNLVVRRLQRCVARCDRSAWKLLSCALSSSCLVEFSYIERVMVLYDDSHKVIMHHLPAWSNVLQLLQALANIHLLLGADLAVAAQSWPPSLSGLSVIYERLASQVNSLSASLVLFSNLVPRIASSSETCSPLLVRGANLGEWAFHPLWHLRRTYEGLLHFLGFEKEEFLTELVLQSGQLLRVALAVSRLEEKSRATILRESYWNEKRAWEHPGRLPLLESLSAEWQGMPHRVVLCRDVLLVISIGSGKRAGMFSTATSKKPNQLVECVPLKGTTVIVDVSRPNSFLIENGSSKWRLGLSEREFFDWKASLEKAVANGQSVLLGIDLNTALLEEQADVPITVETLCETWPTQAPHGFLTAWCSQRNAELRLYGPYEFLQHMWRDKCVPPLAPPYLHLLSLHFYLHSLPSGLHVPANSARMLAKLTGESDFNAMRDMIYSFPKGAQQLLGRILSVVTTISAQAQAPALDILLFSVSFSRELMGLCSAPPSSDLGGLADYRDEVNALVNLLRCAKKIWPNKPSAGQIYRLSAPSRGAVQKNVESLVTYASAVHDSGTFLWSEDDASLTGAFVVDPETKKEIEREPSLAEKLLLGPEHDSAQGEAFAKFLGKHHMHEMLPIFGAIRRYMNLVSQEDRVAQGKSMFSRYLRGNLELGSVSVFEIPENDETVNISATTCKAIRSKLEQGSPSLWDPVRDELLNLLWQNGVEVAFLEQQQEGQQQVSGSLRSSAESKTPPGAQSVSADPTDVLSSSSSPLPSREGSLSSEPNFPQDLSPPSPATMSGTRGAHTPLTSKLRLRAVSARQTRGKSIGSEDDLYKDDDDGNANEEEVKRAFISRRRFSISRSGPDAGPEHDADDLAIPVSAILDAPKKALGFLELIQDANASQDPILVQRRKSGDADAMPSTGWESSPTEDRDMGGMTPSLSLGSVAPPASKRSDSKISFLRKTPSTGIKKSEVQKGRSSSSAVAPPGEFSSKTLREQPARSSAPGETLPWKTVKVVIVGEENAGKTHLARHLENVKYETNLSTDGMEIREWAIGDVDFRLYDFGGQEIFYPTHQLFLTRLSVYLVVFRIDNPDYLARVSYWLRTVAALRSQPAPPILLVGTHVDQIKSINSESDALKSEVYALARSHKQVRDVFFVSSKWNLGIAELRAKMLALGNGLISGYNVSPFVRPLVETVKLTAQVQPVINFQRFRQMASSCGIPLTGAHVADTAQFLHDVGCIMHFGDHSRLDDVVVLDPAWLAEKMADLISFKHNWPNGVLKMAQADVIWKHLDPNKREDILLLLEKFEVIFLKRAPHSKKIQRITIPSLLPKDVDLQAVALGLTPALGLKLQQRQYVLVWLPQGAMGRLIARFQNYQDFHFLHQWHMGLVLSTKAGQKGLIHCSSDYSAGIFTLRVVACEGIFASHSSSDSGIRPKSLIQDLVAVVDSWLQDLSVRTGAITAFCSSCMEMYPTRESGLFPYADLVDAFLLSGEMTVKCSVCGNGSVPIGDMAPDITLCHLPFLENLVMGDLLGRGGFASVHRATLADGTPVAVKALLSHADRSQLATRFRQFQQEIVLLSKLSHPNIVRLHGVVKTSAVSLVMEYCPFPDLSTYLYQGTEPPFILVQTLRIGCDVACALAYLHAQSPPVVHRDVRSPNIFMVSMDHRDASPMAKLGDFGLASTVAPWLSQVLSTFQWVAPEALLGAQYDDSVDVYSLSIVMAEILTRKLPFTEFTQFFDRITKWSSFYCSLCGEGNVCQNDPDCSAHQVEKTSTGEKFIWRERQVKDAITEQRVRPSLPPSCPSALADLIQRGWAHNPAMRPSALEFAEQLAVLLRAEDESSFAPLSLNSTKLRNTLSLRAIGGSSGSGDLVQAASAQSTCILISQPLRLAQLGGGGGDMAHLWAEPWSGKSIMMPLRIPIARFETSCWIARPSGEVDVVYFEDEPNDPRNINVSEIEKFSAHGGFVTCMLHSPDAGLVWTCGSDGFVYSWTREMHQATTFSRTQRGSRFKKKHTIKGHGVPMAIAEAGPGCVALGYTSGALLLCDGRIFKDGQLLAVCREVSAPILSLVALQEGPRTVKIWAGSLEGKIYVFQLQFAAAIPPSLQLIKSVSCAPSLEPVYCLSLAGTNLWASAGSQMFQFSASNTVFKDVRAIQGSEERITNVVVVEARGSYHICVSMRDERVRIMDARTNSQYLDLAFGERQIRGLFQFSPTWLLCVDSAGVLKGATII